MRITLALATLSIGATSAAAQAFPPGSYQGSCTQVHWAGTTLVAECRRHDSRTTGTGLPNASRCTGDIANNDGQLICSHGASPPPAATPDCHVARHRRRQAMARLPDPVLFLVTHHRQAMAPMTNIAHVARSYGIASRTCAIACNLRRGDRSASTSKIACTKRTRIASASAASGRLAAQVFCLPGLLAPRRSDRSGFVNRCRLLRAVAAPHGHQELRLAP